MITEGETKALQLAKKVFEHFTHDALPIAREIITLEHELGQSPINGKIVNGAVKAIPEIKKTDGQPVGRTLHDFPVSDISIIGLGVDDDPAQTVPHMHEEPEFTPESLPF